MAEYAGHENGDNHRACFERARVTLALDGWQLDDGVASGVDPRVLQNDSVGTIVGGGRTRGVQTSALPCNGR